MNGVGSCIVAGSHIAEDISKHTTNATIGAIARRKDRWKHYVTNATLAAYIMHLASWNNSLNSSFRTKSSWNVVNGVGKDATVRKPTTSGKAAKQSTIHGVTEMDMLPLPPVHGMDHSKDDGDDDDDDDDRRDNNHDEKKNASSSNYYYHHLGSSFTSKGMTGTGLLIHQIEVGEDATHNGTGIRTNEVYYIHTSPCPDLADEGEDNDDDGDQNREVPLNCTLIMGVPAASLHAFERGEADVAELSPSNDDDSTTIVMTSKAAAPAAIKEEETSMAMSSGDRVAAAAKKDSDSADPQCERGVRSPNGEFCCAKVAAREDCATAATTTTTTTTTTTAASSFEINQCAVVSDSRCVSIVQRQREWQGQRSSGDSSGSNSDESIRFGRCCVHADDVGAWSTSSILSQAQASTLDEVQSLKGNVHTRTCNVVGPPCSLMVELGITVSLTRSLLEGQSALPDPEGLVQLALSETNQAFRDSQIPVRVVAPPTNRVRWVSIARVRSSSQQQQPLSYLDDSPDSAVLLQRLRGWSDARLPGTQLAVLLSGNIQSCGRAFLDCARYVDNLSVFESCPFAVVHVGCATGYYSFAHEIGHILGMDHQRQFASVSSSRFSDNYGLVMRPGFASDGAVRSIMAYAYIDELRVPLFTSPSVFYSPNSRTTTTMAGLGVQTGRKDTEDNARVATSTRYVVVRLNLASATARPTLLPTTERPSVPPTMRSGATSHPSNMPSGFAQPQHPPTVSKATPPSRPSRRPTALRVRTFRPTRWRERKRNPTVPGGQNDDSSSTTTEFDDDTEARNSTNNSTDNGIGSQDEPSHLTSQVASGLGTVLLLYMIRRQRQARARKNAARGLHQPPVPPPADLKGAGSTGNAHTIVGNARLEKQDDPFTV